MNQKTAKLLKKYTSLTSKKAELDEDTTRKRYQVAKKVYKTLPSGSRYAFKQALRKQLED